MGGGIGGSRPRDAGFRPGPTRPLLAVPTTPLIEIIAKKPVKPKKSPAEPDKKARVHKELEGFEIGVNPLGEITSNYSLMLRTEQINQFLGRHVRD